MTQFDEALRSFVELSNATMTCLSGAMALIEEGIAPSIDKSNEASRLLLELRDAYATVKGIATESLSEETVESDDESVYRYKKQLDELRESMINQQVEDAKSVISSFLAVRSDEQVYADAIRPIQDEARTTLDVLMGDVSTIVSDDGELSVDIDTPSLFMEALGKDAVDYALLDEVSKKTSFAVGAGLMGGAYYLESDASSLADVLEKVVSANTKDDEHAKALIDTDGITIETLEDPTMAGEEPQSKPEPGQEPESEAAIVPVRPVKAEVKLGVKSLENKFLSRMHRTGICTSTVVPVLMRFGACTTDQLVSLCQILTSGVEKISREDVLQSIYSMERANITCTFSLEGEDVHCMTIAGRRVLMRDSIRNRALPNKNGSFWPIALEDHECRAGSKMLPSELRAIVVENDELLERYSRIAEDRGRKAAVVALRSTHRANGTYVLDMEGDAFDDQDEVTSTESDPSMEAVYVSESDEPGSKDDPQRHAGDGAAVLENVEASPQTDSNSAERAQATDEALFEAIVDLGETDQVDAKSLDGISRAANRATEASKEEKRQEEEPAPAAEKPEYKTEGEELITSEEKACNSFELAQTYIEDKEPPSDHEMATLAMDMADEVDVSAGVDADLSGVTCAWTLLKAVSGDDRYIESLALLKQMSLAIGPVTDDTLYTSNTLFDAFGRSGSFDEGLMLASCLNAMAMPHWGKNDQVLWSQCKSYLEDYDTYFPSYGVVRPLFRTLYGLHDVSGEGFSSKVITFIDEGKNRQAVQAEIRERAKKLTEPRRFSAYHPGVPLLSKNCFGSDSMLGIAMAMIGGGTPISQKHLTEVCQRLCDEGDGSKVVSAEKIGEYLDEIWHDIIADLDGNKRGKPDRLKYSTRDQAIAACKERVNVVIEWLDIADEGIDPDRVVALRSIRHDVLSTIDNMISSGVLEGKPKAAIVLCAISALAARLHGDKRRPLDFTCFLTSGYVSLDEDMLPIVNGNLNSIRYAEPWRQVLRHYVSSPISLEEASEKILGRDNPMSDNLRQLAHIHSLLGVTESERVIEKRAAQAEAAAEERLERFQNDLEVNVLYNRITDDDKETIDGSWRACKDFLYGTGDYGVWTQLLDALNKQIRDMAAGQHETLSRQLDRRFQQLNYGEDSSLLEVTRRLLDEERNYATVEEYINLFDEGERTIADSIHHVNGMGEITDFLNDDINDRLFERYAQRARTSNRLTEISKVVLKDYARDGAELPERSDSFFTHWPDDNYAGYEKRSLGFMLRRLGFNVRAPKPVKVDAQTAHYTLDFQPSAKGLRDYPHPISLFGTLAEPKLHVLLTSSRVTPNEIFNKVESLNNQGMTVVISNRAMRLSERRKMAETCHVRKSGLTPFICIDRILALHLAMVDEDSRLPELLRCTLPFTHCQPFIHETGSTSDEMFFGRKKELRSILDPQGATFVYGGRQLGKSALLERAEHFFNNEQDKNIAVYCKIDAVTDDDELVEHISDALYEKGLKLGRKFSGIDGLCQQIERSLSDGRANHVLVLIDEADAYLKAISDNNYANLRPMVDLWRKTQGSFKFVMAGLHNVSRAKNATQKNGIFGQLATLVIRPLERQDALQLIARPLSYLGYRIDEYPYLMTILTKTNYYPGILQFFGYSLVESISEHYGQYYRAADGNPPYALDPAQLGAILNKSELRESIKKKFRLSLDLSERYQAIARVFALLYRDCEDREENIRERDGFSVSEVWEMVEGLSVPQLVNEDLVSFKVLLDEMCDMNILFRGNDDEPVYRLRHYDFLRIIGGRDIDEILDELIGGAR